MAELIDGARYWATHVDHPGSGTEHMYPELTEPWLGEVVSEQRAGGRFVVLASRLGPNNELRDAFYLVIPHESAASRLLFVMFEKALAAWEAQTRARGLSLIEEGSRMLRELPETRDRLVVKNRGY